MRVEDFQVNGFIFTFIDEGVIVSSSMELNDECIDALSIAQMAHAEWFLLLDTHSISYPLKSNSTEELNRILDRLNKCINFTIYKISDGVRADYIDIKSSITKILDSREHRKKPKSNLKSKSGYVYLLQSPTSAYKIGRTKNPKNRQRTFSIKLPFEVEFIAVIESRDMYSLEADLHDMFSNKRVNGEWFELSEDDVEYIKGLAE